MSVSVEIILSLIRNSQDLNQGRNFFEGLVWTLGMEEYEKTLT
jgi:hypothetical protein